MYMFLYMLMYIYGPWALNMYGIIHGRSIYNMHRHPVDNFI